MGTVYLFAGNFVTGEVKHTVVRNDDEEIAKAIGLFMGDLGRDHFFWEIYNTAQSLEVREVQFNNRLERAREEFMEHAA